MFYSLCFATFFTLPMFFSRTFFMLSFRTVSVIMSIHYGFFLRMIHPLGYLVVIYTSLIALFLYKRSCHFSSYTIGIFLSFFFIRFFSYMSHILGFFHSCLSHMFGLFFSFPMCHLFICVISNGIYRYQSMDIS